MATQIDKVDLDHILKQTASLWEEVKGQSVFITGGTGFFGRWLLESFVWANDQLHLEAQATVLSRDPEVFAAKAPYLASHNAIHLVRGDVRTFEFPDGKYRFVIHAATEASTNLNREHPLLMFETIVDGTKRTLEFARTHGTTKFLLTSSGAVYGKQPSDLTHISENYVGAPDSLDPGSAYGEGKRAAEVLCRLYAHQFGIELKIARCFAFVGPYLPMDANYAIGNFIRDACQSNRVTVGGDGTPYRSYLYAADLAIWLWTILLKGQSCRAFNVGSDECINIADLADMVCHLADPAVGVTVAKKADPAIPPQRYVPSIDRAKNELGLNCWVSLEESIKRTLSWQRK